MRSHQRVLASVFTISVLSLALGLGTSATAQEPIDLFPDNPELASGFVRICAWNLRHINLEEAARQFLPGQNDTEDLAILIATFAKGLRDLGCDLAAIVEVQPRVGEPDRLLQLRDRLNGPGGGPWQADQTNIEYDNPNDQFGNLQLGLLWNSVKVTIDRSIQRPTSSYRNSASRVTPTATSRSGACVSRGWYRSGRGH
jgi:hypothetical protein